MKSGWNDKRRLIVGVSGASGFIYAVRLLDMLRALDIESHLVVTKSADLTRAHETALSAKEFQEKADVVHNINEMGAAISSGSFKTMGMIIAPCSIRSMSEIASGISSNLLTRAADVCLKERRRVVLLLRETPLHAGHIRSMLAVTEAGAVIAPPVPAFYAKPNTLEEMVDHTIGRVLDLFDLEAPAIRRWGESLPSAKSTDEMKADVSAQSSYDGTAFQEARLSHEASQEPA